MSIGPRARKGNATREHHKASNIKMGSRRFFVNTVNTKTYNNPNRLTFIQELSGFAACASLRHLEIQRKASETAHGPARKSQYFRQ